MTNALTELVESIFLSGKQPEDIVAISIVVDNCRHQGSITGASLDETVSNFLNIEYDSGYGNQELDGVVLFSDNTWLSRAEYDGSEWWRYNKPPTVEEILASRSE